MPLEFAALPAWPIMPPVSDIPSGSRFWARSRADETLIPPPAERSAAQVQAQAAEIFEAQLRLNSAKSEFRQAGTAHAEARKAAAARIAGSLRIDEAVQEAKRTEDVLKQAKEPVLDIVRATPEYQELLRKAATVNVERQSQMAAGQTRQLILDRGNLLAVSSLEHSALAKSAEAAAAREAYEAAHQRVRELGQRAKELVEQDAAVKSAASELASARQSVQTESASVAKESSEVVRAQGDLRAGIAPTAGMRAKR